MKRKKLDAFAKDGKEKYKKEDFSNSKKSNKKIREEIKNLPFQNSFR